MLLRLNLDCVAQRWTTFFFQIKDVTAQRVAVFLFDKCGTYNNSLTTGINCTFIMLLIGFGKLSRCFASLQFQSYFGGKVCVYDQDH